MGLKSIRYIDHDTGESLQTTQYDYTKTTPFKTTITYPSGGISIYNYDPKYCLKDGYEFCKRPFVESHILKEKSTSPVAENQKTSYTYFNANNQEMSIPNPNSNEDIMVTRTETVLSDGVNNNKKQKIDESDYGTEAYSQLYDYDWYGQILREVKKISDGSILKETYYDYVYSYRQTDAIDYEDAWPVSEIAPFAFAFPFFNVIYSTDQSFISLYSPF